MRPDSELDEAIEAQANVERKLLNGGMIVRFRDGSVPTARHAYPVLEALLDPNSQGDRLRKLANRERGRVPFSQRSHLLDDVTETDELRR